MTDTTWRVRYFSRRDVGEPDRADGIQDFPTEAEAAAYFASDEVRTRISSYCRVELQRITLETIADTGYRLERESAQ